MPDNIMIQISGLWLNTSASGRKYFKGKLNGNDLLVFKNEHKTHDKQPDYILYIAPYRAPDTSDDLTEDDPFSDLK